MIRKMFQSLFGWPCDHDWETLIAKQPVNYTTTYADTGETFSRGNGLVWLYRCKKCCKRKKVATP